METDEFNKKLLDLFDIPNEYFIPLTTPSFSFIIELHTSI